MFSGIQKIHCDSLPPPSPFVKSQAKSNIAFLVHGENEFRLIRFWGSNKLFEVICDNVSSLTTTNGKNKPSNFC